MFFIRSNGIGFFVLFGFVFITYIDFTLWLFLLDKTHAIVKCFENCNLWSNQKKKCKWTKSTDKEYSILFEKNGWIVKEWKFFVLPTIVNHVLLWLQNQIVYILCMLVHSIRDTMRYNQRSHSNEWTTSKIKK